MRASQNDDVNLPRAGGQIDFNNNVSGDAVANMLYGFAARGRRTETFLIRSRANSMGAYIQDDWKINPKLSLNLGVRYDLDTPRWEKIDNRQNSFDRFAINPACNCPGLINWSGRDARGGSKYAHNFTFGNIGPRVGFAYRPTDSWVVRGGASMVYIGQYDQATPIVANAGFAIDGDFRAPNNTEAAFRLRDGIPAIPVPDESDLVPGFGAVAAGDPTIFSPQFFQPEDRPMPYLITYNLNFQRMLPWNSVVEFGYLSTLGRKLTVPGAATINQIHPDAIHWVDQGVTQSLLRPFPQFGNVTMLSPTWGASEYHGVNLKFEKRYSGGLQFSMNYTFARAIDNVEGRNELAGEGGNVPFANQYDRDQAWSLGGSHIKHRYITSVVYDIPWGKGRAHSFSNPVLNQIVGGWTLGTIIEARTGPRVLHLVGQCGPSLSDRRQSAGRCERSLPGELQLERQCSWRRLLQYGRLLAAGAVHVWQRWAQCVHRTGRCSCRRLADQAHLHAVGEPQPAVPHRGHQLPEPRELQHPEWQSPGGQLRHGDRPHAGSLGPYHPARAALRFLSRSGRWINRTGASGPPLPFRQAPIASRHAATGLVEALFRAVRYDTADEPYRPTHSEMTMTVLRGITGAYLVAALFSCGPTLGEKGGDRPNILLIVADDLGFSDLGQYGGEIGTPNLGPASPERRPPDAVLYDRPAAVLRGRPS